MNRDPIRQVEDVIMQMEVELRDICRDPNTTPEQQESLESAIELLMMARRNVVEAAPDAFHAGGPGRPAVR